MLNFFRNKNLKAMSCFLFSRMTENKYSLLHCNADFICDFFHKINGSRKEGEEWSDKKNDSFMNRVI